MSFAPVCNYKDLPDASGKIVRVGLNEIALFKVGEDVFAIDNECPHQEGPLGDGDLEGEIVTCPFHAWEVNVRTGEVMGFTDLCSRKFACKVEDGQVFVEI